MTNVLIILTLPEPVRNRYYDHLRQTFPDLAVTMVDHPAKADPHIATADVLVTFGVQIADHADALFAKAGRLKWIQALGTGIDSLIDQPALCPDWLITNLHGIHCPAMSQAPLLPILSLRPDWPPALRNQSRRRGERRPSPPATG